jgi:hypothetical protein
MINYITKLVDRRLAAVELDFFKYALSRREKRMGYWFDPDLSIEMDCLRTLIDRNEVQTSLKDLTAVNHAK